MDATLIVVLVCYFVGLVAVAVVANRQKQQDAGEGASAGHFSGSFSTGALILTTASTIFSGATVAGIPAEVGQIGYLSFRWFCAMFGIVASMLIIYPRLRRAATSRGYQSPCDFIADRYRSRRLRMLTTLCASGGSLMYLTIQFNSFGLEFQSIFGGEIWMGMTAFTIIVVFMEKLGGMKSVVYTDMIQSSIMIVCFIVLPFMMWARYGAFWSLADNCTTTQDASTENGERITGCVREVAPALLKYPSLPTAMNSVFWFSFSMMAFPLNLHLVQRCYIASTDRALRTVMLALLVSAFLCYPPGIYMGFVGVAYKNDLPGTPSAFNNILSDLQEASFFHDLFVSILHCCYMAAIMSTTDSILMGVSANVSMDVFKGWLTPDVSAERFVFIAEMCSLLQCVFASLVGFWVSPPKYGTILGLSNGFLFQIAPAYILGLWTNVSTRAVTCGIAAGIVAFIFAWFILDPKTNDLNMHMPDEMIGVAANVIVIFLVNFIAPGDDDESGSDADELNRRFGGRLKPETITRALGISQMPPKTASFGAILMLLLATPMYEPKATDQRILFGMPHFALLMLVTTFAGGLMTLIGVIAWNPDERVVANAESLNDLPGIEIT